MCLQRMAGALQISLKYLLGQWITNDSKALLEHWGYIVLITLSLKKMKPTELRFRGSDYLRSLLSHKSHNLWLPENL